MARTAVRTQVREPEPPASVEVRPAAPAAAHEDDSGARSRLEQVRTLVREAESRGESLTGSQVARALGVSAGYARRLLQRARAA